jgi:hypothetical protein
MNTNRKENNCVDKKGKDWVSRTYPVTDCDISGAEPSGTVFKKFRAGVVCTEIWSSLSLTEIQLIPHVTKVELSHGRPAFGYSHSDEGQRTSHFKCNSNSRP